MYVLLLLLLYPIVSISPSLSEANISVGRQTSWHPGHTLSGSDPMLHHHGNETERLSVEQDATGAVTPTVSNFLDVQYSELNSTVTPIG